MGNYVSVENFLMYQNQVKMELKKIQKEVENLKNEIESKEETKTKAKGK